MGHARGDLLLLIAVLAAFGVVDAADLTYEWYAAGSASWCDVSSYFSCTKVRESPYAAVGGIPTATIGVVGFVLILLLAVMILKGLEVPGPWRAQRWLLALAVVGALIGLGLTVLEVAVIQAVCLLCALGFGLDLGILGLAVVDARAVQSASRSE